ncbi:hypothetical protein D7X99_36725 [Corallococcus sp. AB032C]|nr:hypothetical protein D7X99_36725 [Corallococcus sp. AB032C]
MAAEWCPTLSDLWPTATFEVDFETKGQLPSSQIHKITRHIPTADSLGIKDYLRALRVVAGQVMLTGEPLARPIQDIFMEVEIAPLGQRRETPGSSRQSQPDPTPAESTEEDIQAEIDARKNAMLGISSHSAVSTEALLSLAQRVFIWGNAGTGKSTLLRLLACRAAVNAQSQKDALQPLWIPWLENLLTDQPAERLVELAMAAVHLPVDRTSPLYQALRDSILSGKAHLFLDGFDEAGRRVPSMLSDLNEGLFFHIASRPTRALIGRFTEVELNGLTGPAAQLFLISYFGNQPWIVPLLRELRALPDGARWTRTPVLLSLAGALYRRIKRLPGTTLELYGEVLGVNETDDSFNQQRPLDHACASLSGEVSRQSIVKELSRVAREMLLPETRDPQVSFQANELPDDMRDALRASGLFIGLTQLRFAHLTFGEYFAARSEFDLSKARARWRTEFSKGPEEALEVLPMAHAFQGLAALKAVLEEAAHDSADHCMLRLLLRAISYGGTGVSEFCEVHSAEVMALLVGRMQMPSGRFGNDERRLMDAGERALPVLKPYLQRGVGLQIDYKTALAALLETSGEAGTEAHILAWTLGLRVPERRTSNWWATIHRMARSFVRLGLSIAQIIELTKGADSIRQSTALKALAKYSAYWPPLRTLLRNSRNRLREDAIDYLENDEGARALTREGLLDDQARVRMTAVKALGGDSTSIDALANAIFDRHSFVRSFAVRALARHPERRKELHQLIAGSDLAVADEAISAVATDPGALHHLREYFTDRLSQPPSHYLHHIDQAAQALRNDPLSRQSITEALRRPTAFFRAETLRVLAEDPEWRLLVRSRLDNGDHRAVKALADFPEYKADLRKLLHGTDENLLIGAIEAFGADAESIEAIRPHLDSPEHNVRHSAIKALGQHSAARPHLRSFFRQTADARWTPKIHIELLRSQVLHELAGDSESRLMLEDALTDKFDDVRIAAIKALSAHPLSRSKIKQLLHDRSQLVAGAALEALADEPAIRETLFSAIADDLWAPRLVAFILLANEVTHRQEMRTLLNHKSIIRSSLFQPLSRDPESIDFLYEQFKSLNSPERQTLIHLLKDDPRMKRLLRTELEHLWSTGDDAHLLPIREYAEILADDQEAKPVLRALLLSENLNIAAEIAPAMARDPESKPRLFSLLSSDVPTAKAAAIEALGADPEMWQRLKETLTSKDDDYARAAAIRALSADPESRDILRDFLSDRNESIRSAAFYSLSGDPDSQGLLWERLREEPTDELRANIAESLASEPNASKQSRERLRACLADPVSRVRRAAQRALCPSPPPLAFPLSQVPSLRIPLSLTEIPSIGLSAENYHLQSRLAAFIKSPVSCALEEDVELAEAVLGWLCIRLAWSAQDGSMRTGRIFGEVSSLPPSLLANSEALVIRVAMDASELPTERFLHPMHNLIEAWAVAKFLHARTPPAIVLVCADVTWEDIAIQELSPGQVCWGPSYFGFRLGNTP